MIHCKYTGSLLDPSGYGDANRADVMALYLAGVNVTTEIVSQTLATTTYGWQGELVKYLEGLKTSYKVKIIHLTPDLYPKYLEDKKYHIGRLAWEVDKLPEEWVDPCNQMQEIWTMTDRQKDIIKGSGVTTPIHVFSEPLDVVPLERNIDPWVIPSFSGTVFYSIFQWIERKDPWSLLTTYWKTFEGREDVVLILKTYRTAYTDSDFNKIKEDIERWKKGLKLRHYPRVLLVKDLWSMDKVWKLHKMGGVFVTTSHGEGWQRPAVEAMLMGNSVIAIDKTGFADVVPPNLFYPVACAESVVVPQSSIPWYSNQQKWWNVSTTDLSKTLLEVYNNLNKAREKGMKSSQFVKDNFNYHTVGFQMANRLREIERFL